jgi:hypothetical protein
VAGYTLFSEAEKHCEMKDWLEGKSDMGDAELLGKARTSVQGLEMVFGAAW